MNSKHASRVRIAGLAVVASIIQAVSTVSLAGTGGGWVCGSGRSWCTGNTVIPAATANARLALVEARVRIEEQQSPQGRTVSLKFANSNGATRVFEGSLAQDARPGMNPGRVIMDPSLELAEGWTLIEARLGSTRLKVDAMALGASGILELDAHLK